MTNNLSPAKKDRNMIIYENYIKHLKIHISYNRVRDTHCNSRTKLF